MGATTLRERRLNGRSKAKRWWKVGRKQNTRVGHSRTLHRQPLENASETLTRRWQTHSISEQKQLPLRRGSQNPGNPVNGQKELPQRRRGRNPVNGQKRLPQRRRRQDLGNPVGQLTAMVSCRPNERTVLLTGNFFSGQARDEGGCHAGNASKGGPAD